jgi:cytosine/adenosine deaminase-related metal-dependent hydrolase
LVNAHTHLDLTHIGPRPYDAERGFVGWVEMIRRERPATPEAIRAAVREGITLSLTGGTVVVGDIAGAPLGKPRMDPFEVLAASAMLGVSFVEFFGIGSRAMTGLDRLKGLAAEVRSCSGPDPWRARAGLQPHAPNTVDLRLFEQATREGVPLATHLAETAEEREFIALGTGPQRELLERLGLWEDSILERVGKGRRPVAHLEPALSAARFLAAHVNDCDDSAIEVLARTATTVAYCPRASEYFGAERVLGPHRYREMARAGVKVALGTDSIVNLPAAEANRGISVLDEMRLLHARDGTDPGLLLRMATVNGGTALGLPSSAFEFAPEHRLAGLVAVEVEGAIDPGIAVMRSKRPARLLATASGFVRG